MNKLIITLLVFNFFEEMYAPDTESSSETDDDQVNSVQILTTDFTEQLHYRVIEEDRAVNSFNEIQSNQVLPLVVILDNITGEFEPPEGVEAVILNNGRIINGTKFTTMNPGEQMFFCPKEDSDETCLVRKEFQGVEPLECAKEATVVVRGEQGDPVLNKCGLNGIGTPYTVVYEICSKPEPDNYVMKEIPIYSFCYDSIKKKTLFTNHGIIFPELLHSKALNLERNIQYQMAMIEEYAPSNLIELEAAMMAEAQEGFHLHLIDLNKRPNYKAAKFVPSEDKPFALWIKSTHQYFNVELQHEVLIPLWDELSHHIRLDAKTKWIRYCITTGVFDLTSNSRGDNQLTNVWVKMVYEVSNMPWENPSHAMVILMDNFIDFTTPSDEEENEMKEYCEKNLCIDDLKEKFKRVGGRVRCCSLTAKMRELLGMELQDTTSSMPVLLIPGINDEVAESSSSFKNILN